jgi:RNA polymerase sigma-70 factor (ECF subfamily)
MRLPSATGQPTDHWIGARTEPIPGGEPGPAVRPPPPEEIYEKHAPRVYNLARRLLGNAADAEDVTQDVFLQVVRNLPTFRGEAAFSTWLYRVAVNAALAYRRKRALREGRRVPDPLEEFTEDGSHRAPVRRWVSQPEQHLLDREAHQVIEQAIAGLPESYRDVYVLADVEELATAEIAEMLGLSVAAVKSRLHRARLLMRKALAPYFEEQAA